MVWTPEENAAILRAHWRSGTQNADGTWSYSIQSCIQQFQEQFPDTNVAYDVFVKHRAFLVKKWEKDYCICKKKSTGRPAKLTTEVVYYMRKTMEENPTKTLPQLAAQTGLSVGSCHKALRSVRSKKYKKESAVSTTDEGAGFQLKMEDSE